MKKGILIIVKEINKEIKIIKEVFQKDSKNLYREFLEFVPKKGEGIAFLIGKERKEYLQKGILFPLDIKTSIPF